MTKDEFLTQARALRAEAEAAKERFLAFLYDGEKMTDIWADTGGTYVEFIERANLCKATRFLAYKRVRDGLGEEALTGVGVEAIVAAGSLKTPNEQREVIDRSRTWENTNGTAISEQSAQRIVRDAKVRSATLTSRGKGWSEIVTENERLKAENTALKTENAALKAELKTLKTTEKKGVKSAKTAQKKAA